MEENENLAQSGAEEASPEPKEPARQESQEAAPKESAPAKPNTESEENVPFHKHPRWVERDNELKAERERRSDLERKYEQMQAQLQRLSEPKPQDKWAPLKERLKGIDPEFAEYVQSLAPAKEMEEMRAWKQQQEAQSVRQQALQQLEGLHTQHKITDASLKSRYDLAIQAKVQANPNLRLEDLPRVYKEVHDDYSQWLDTIRRTEREQYVKAKQASSAAPTSQSKGAPVKADGKKPEWSKNRDEARQQLIQRTLEKARASREVG